MTETAAVKQQIILTTRGQVIDFLKTRPDVDIEIRWTCPECEALNVGAYHSHTTLCWNCGKYAYPRLYLSRKGVKKSMLATAAAEERRHWIIGRLKEIDGEIQGHHDEIFMLDMEINELNKELQDINYAGYPQTAPGVEPCA